MAKWFQLWIVKTPAWTQDNLREQMDCRLGLDCKASLLTVGHLRIRTSFLEISHGQMVETKEEGSAK